MYLFVDLYKGDEGPHPPWQNLAPPFYGAIIKATQGLAYEDNGWFKDNWAAIRAHAGYGDTWFRGAYHFLDFRQSGVDQAKFYLNTIRNAGGWWTGDLLPIVDVELGRSSVATKQQVIKTTTDFAKTIKSETGRRCMGYGRGAMRDLGIVDHMGLDIIWNPSYTATMRTMEGQGWKLEDIGLWQYCGDGEAYNEHLPSFIPNFGNGRVDISVYVDGANVPTLETLKARLM